MVASFTKAAALAALLCPLVASLGVPASNGLKPRLSREIYDLPNHQKRDGYPTGCTNGPSSRSCWKGDFNIDTDMDEHWPDTGKVVKVRIHAKLEVFDVDNHSTTLTSQMRPWRRMGSQGP